MRERRITVDLDELGRAIQWTVDLYDDLGERVFIHVGLSGMADADDPHDAFGRALAYEAPIQMQLPVAWQRWLVPTDLPEGDSHS